MKCKLAIALSALLLGSCAAGEIAGHTFSYGKANIPLAVENLLLPATAEAAAQNNENEEEELPHFVFLFSDDGFNYYMDSYTSRRTTPPAGSEKLVDVWIKVLPIGLAPETEVTTGQKYYLQHYLLRPKKDQIMFLSELEVEGRPDNNIKERPYNSKNWENLVPGSLEENIYRECMKYRLELKKRGNKKSATRTIGDFIDDTFRISL